MKVACDADYGGKTEHIEVQPTRDVFSFQSADLGSRFRFLAQHLTQQARLKTFVYELREKSAVLIHAGEYQLPMNQCPQPSSDFGLNKIYSSDFGRELFFRCTADCE